MKSSLAILVLTLICSGCNATKDASVAAAAAPAPAVASIVQTTAPLPANDTAIVATGPVVVENQIDVAAQREGVLAAVLAEPGANVRKGQVLARLDDRQVTADLDGAIAKVHALEANLDNWRAETKVLLADRDRAQKLYDAQVIPKEELDHAIYKEQADEFEIKRENESLNNARDVQRSLELEKEKTTICAPFDGVVARRYVRVGQKIAVGDRLFWVTAMSPLEVKFTLPEKYFGKVRQGGSVTVSSADVSPEAKYSAKVVQVSPVVDASSGTMEVLALITDTHTELRPGMLVNVSMTPHP